MKKIIISAVVLVVLVTAGLLFLNKKSGGQLEPWEQELHKQLQDKSFHKPVVDIPKEIQTEIKTSCYDFFSVIARLSENELVNTLGYHPEWKDYQPFAKELKKHYGNMIEITIGEPFYVEAFTSNIYVPYKLKFKDGYIKEWQVAIRYYNSKGQPLPSYYIDGGI